MSGPVWSSIDGACAELPGESLTQFNHNRPHSSKLMSELHGDLRSRGKGEWVNATCGGVYPIKSLT